MRPFRRSYGFFSPATPEVKLILANNLIACSASHSHRIRSLPAQGKVGRAKDGVLLSSLAEFGSNLESAREELNAALAVSGRENTNASVSQSLREAQALEAAAEGHQKAARASNHRFQMKRTLVKDLAIEAWDRLVSVAKAVADADKLAGKGGRLAAKDPPKALRALEKAGRRADRAHSAALATEAKLAEIMEHMREGRSALHEAEAEISAGAVKIEQSRAMSIACWDLLGLEVPVTPSGKRGSGSGGVTMMTTTSDPDASPPSYSKTTDNQSERDRHSDHGSARHGCDTMYTGSSSSSKKDSSDGGSVSESQASARSLPTINSSDAEMLRLYEVMNRDAAKLKEISRQRCAVEESMRQEKKNGRSGQSSGSSNSSGSSSSGSAPKSRPVEAMLGSLRQREERQRARVDTQREAHRRRFLEMLARRQSTLPRPNNSTAAASASSAALTTASAYPLKDRGEAAPAEQNPALVSYYFHLATELEDAELLVEAVEAYELSLFHGGAYKRNSNKHPETHYNLAILLDQLGRYEESIASSRAALQCRPHWAEAHYNLGQTYDACGNLEQAVKCYASAVATKPDWEDARHNLAVAEHERDLALKSNAAPSPPKDGAGQPKYQGGYDGRGVGVVGGSAYYGDEQLKPRNEGAAVSDGEDSADAASDDEWDVESACSGNSASSGQSFWSARSGQSSYSSHSSSVHSSIDPLKSNQQQHGRGVGFDNAGRGGAVRNMERSQHQQRGHERRKSLGQKDEKDPANCGVM